VRTGLLDELRHRLLSDEGIAYARKRLAEGLGEVSRERDASLREARRKIEVLTSQIDQLVNFIAAGHGTATVADKLRALEREADAQRVEVAALEKDATAVIELPAPDDLFALVFDLEKRLLADPTRGREELRLILRDGRIMLLPQPSGFFIARSEILPLVLLTPPPSEGDQGGRYTASSCAGSHIAISHGESVGIPYVFWLPAPVRPFGAGLKVA
jgi:hypothetical protein